MAREKKPTADQIPVLEDLRRAAALRNEAYRHYLSVFHRALEAGVGPSVIARYASISPKRRTAREIGLRPLVTTATLLQPSTTCSTVPASRPAPERNTARRAVDEKPQVDDGRAHQLARPACIKHSASDRYAVLRSLGRSIHRRPCRCANTAPIAAAVRSRATV